MSASTRTAQAGLGFGGFKSGLAALALVVILAATVAIVALGVSRSAPAATQANPVPAPIILDKGSRDEMNRFPAVPYIIDRDHGDLGGAVAPALPWGGWNGPRAADPGDNTKDDTYVPSTSGNGGHGTRFAQ